MKQEVGASFSVDGAEKFNSEMTKIKNQIKAFGAEAKAAATSADLETSSQDKLRNSNVKLSSEMELQKKKISMLSEELKRQTSVLGENNSATLQTRTDLAKSTIALNKMQSEIQSNIESIKKLDEEENKKTSFQDNCLKDSKSLNELNNNINSSISSFSVFGNLLKANLSADIIKTAISSIGNAISSLSKKSTEYISDEAEDLNQFKENILLFPLFLIT